VKSPLAQAAIFAVALFAWQWYTSAPDASELGESYVQELAEIARETARKCRSGEFKSPKDISVYTKEQVKASHKLIFDSKFDRMLDDLNQKLEGKYDGEAYGDGWDKIAKSLGG
jgi:hypothetical protein